VPERVQVERPQPRSGEDEAWTRDDPVPPGLLVGFLASTGLDLSPV